MGLFGPAWMASKPSKQQQALEAVAEISDQRQLADVFLRAPLGAVRKAALARIDDEDLIIKLVRESLQCHREWVAKLSSPRYLIEIASCEQEPRALAAALAKIRALNLPAEFDNERTDRVLSERVARIIDDYKLAWKHPCAGFTGDSYVDDMRELTPQMRSIRMLATVHDRCPRAVDTEMVLAIARETDIPLLLELAENSHFCITVLQEMGHDPELISAMRAALHEKEALQREAGMEQLHEISRLRQAAGMKVKKVEIEERNDEIHVTSWKPF
jgi:hypothetical protein